MPELRMKGKGASLPLKPALALAALFSILSAVPVEAQMWRLSGGYSIQHFGLVYDENPAYGEPVGLLNKGVAELELERYLLYRFYLGANANFQLHNQETVFMGGPLDFRQANMGVTAGMQWPKFGLYAGVQAGRLWNMRFLADSGDTGTARLRPRDHGDGLWTTGLRGGFKYYLLRWVRLQGEVVRHTGLPETLEPRPVAGTTPHIRQASFDPYSFRVGISISIPWHSQRRLDRIEESDRLPVLLEAGGTLFRAPLRNDTYITSPFGSRWGRSHEGVDLKAERGDAVVAAASGVVTHAGRQSGYGRMIEIRHSGGYTTRYAHLHRIRARVGQSVRRGEVIGSAGNSGSATGYHLHFEVRRQGEPLDPRDYIRF